MKIKTLIPQISEKRLMGLWQEIVKKRAGYRCEYANCRKTEHLNAHHIYSKSRRSTRYDPDNGICLCASHHSLGNDSAHKNPNFKDIIIKGGVRSQEFWEKLERRAYTPQKLDKNLTYLDLINELSKYDKRI